MTAAALFLGLHLRADDAPAKPKATADTIILLWMAGGQAATEVWDMKKYTPFEKGMEAKSVYSTFKAVPTSVDGLQISEGMPNVAKVMHQGALIKTFKAGDLGFHPPPPRHQYHLGTPATCRLQPVAAPHLGAVVARQPSGRDTPTCPPSSTSAAAARPAAKTSRSRPSRRPASSAMPTAPSSCPNRPTPSKPSSRRPACRREPLRPSQLRGCTSRRSRSAATPPASTPRNRSSSSRWTAPAGSHPELAGRQGVRPQPGAERDLRHLQRRQGEPLRPRLSAGPAAGRGRRPLHRGVHRVRCRVPGLRHPRERPQPDGGHDEDDRRARSPQYWSRTSTSGNCSTAR